MPNTEWLAYILTIEPDIESITLLSAAVERMPKLADNVTAIGLVCKRAHRGQQSLVEAAEPTHEQLRPHCSCLGFAPARNVRLVGDKSCCVAFAKNEHRQRMLQLIRPRESTDPCPN